MKKLPSFFVGIAVLTLAAAPALPAAQSTKTESDSTDASPRLDTGSALVQLKGDPLSTYIKTKPAKGKKIDFTSNTTKSYRAQLSALRNDFKAWLRANAPAAKVTSEFDISLNAVSVQLNGVTLETLRKAPQANRVEYQGIYYPVGAALSDPDLNLINAVQAWALGGGAANAGDGVKVAIIDSGIDIRHPCFNDAGYPSRPKIGDPRFTNNKVIAAKVFNNKAGVKGYTAEGIDSHGTHVAGTVGCNFDTIATVNGVNIPHGISGVAPRALLGNYNVFPADVASARSEDILNALEAAYADGFDVANMSLGGGSHGIQDLVSVAVDDLDQANMVVAVAAGNSGPGLFTVESPGIAPRALSAGAASVGHFVAAPVTAGGSSYPGVAGEFATVTADLSAPLGVVSSGGGVGNGCGALAAGSLTGKIALIARGTCSFSVKIRNAQAAGAVAVLIVNNVPGDAVGMAQDGTPGQPTIPAYMVSRADGAVLAALDGTTVTLGASLSYFVSGNNDFMAGFSSQGPTDVDFRVKPDVVAPGVNVLSSIPVSNCGGNPCFAFFQGTSMATPHLAGSAAIVRWLHPDYSAAQVRSAIVNTADQGVLKKSSNGTAENDVNVIGTGRENLLAAAGATVALDPVSVSFGAIPSGSGQTKSATVTLSNLGTQPKTVSLSVGAGDASVAYTVSPSSVTIAAGGSASVTVVMSAAQGAAGGGHQATLTVSSGGSEAAHAAVYTLIK